MTIVESRSFHTDPDHDGPFRSHSIPVQPNSYRTSPIPAIPCHIHSPKSIHASPSYTIPTHAIPGHTNPNHIQTNIKEVKLFEL